jgi:hypothetical protein
MAGRPRKFTDVDDLQEMIDEYFRDCDPHVVDVEVLEYPKRKISKGKREWEEDDVDAEPEVKIRRRISKQIPYGVAGLAYACGVTRDTLLEYEKGVYDLQPGAENYDPEAPQFSDTIKIAKARILAQKEFRLATNEVNPAAGIFDLKVNYGYNEQPTSPDDPLNVSEIKITIDYADRPALPEQTRVQVPNTPAAHQEPLEAELIDEDDEEIMEPQSLYANDPEPAIRVIMADV